MTTHKRKRAPMARKLFEKFIVGAGLNTAEIARHLKVSESLISKYRSGARNINHNTVMRLRFAFPNNPISAQIGAVLDGNIPTESE